MADECDEDYEQNVEGKTQKNAVEEFLESRTQLFNLPFRFEQQKLDSTSTLKRLNKKEMNDWTNNDLSFKFDDTLLSKRIKKDFSPSFVTNNCEINNGKTLKLNVFKKDS